MKDLKLNNTDQERGITRLIDVKGRQIHILFGLLRERHPVHSRGEREQGTAHATAQEERRAHESDKCLFGVSWAHGLKSEWIKIRVDTVVIVGCQSANRSTKLNFNIDAVVRKIQKMETAYG